MGVKNLFNQIVGRTGKSLGDCADPAGLVRVLLGSIGSEQGGLVGLTQLFREQGLGDVVDSWVGNGVKHPLSARQVREVLGDERLAALGQATGLAPETVVSRLAACLPQAVSSLTSDGV